MNPCSIMSDRICNDHITMSNSLWIPPKSNSFLAIYERLLAAPDPEPEPEPNPIPESNHNSTAAGKHDGTITGRLGRLLLTPPR